MVGLWVYIEAAMYGLLYVSWDPPIVDSDLTCGDTLVVVELVS